MAVATPRRGKPSGGPWYGDERQRILFECGARGQVPGLRARTNRAGPRAGRCYLVTLDVPHYPARAVTVLFPRHSPRSPAVNADGPEESPHRGNDGSLCMWEPSDPSTLRWVFGDGMLSLLGIAVAHLFREAWWRETGEWPGPEAPHDVAKGPNGEEG